MNLLSYLEQHKSIGSEIEKIKEIIKINDFEEHADEIAHHINTLAGKLKIHLLNEDRYLYPNLKESKDNNVANLAQEYQDEMGDFALEFTNFKDKYNTKSKLLINKLDFRSEIDFIIRKIENRIKKEENGIYKLIS